MAPEGLDSDAPAQGRLPVRTCVGCRKRAAKSELLRVVARGGACLPDPSARQPGRGAYLHPVPGCLEVAQRRRALARALRVQGSLDVTAVAAMIEQIDINRRSTTTASDGSGAQG